MTMVMQQLAEKACGDGDGIVGCATEEIVDGRDVWLFM